MAGKFAEPYGGRELSYLAGLWHDVGKADPRWQMRLLESERGERQRVGLDHKCGGVLLAEEAGGFASSAGLLIHGHHGGLQNRHVYQSWLEENRCLPGPSTAIEVLSLEMDDLMIGTAIPQPTFADAREAEMFLRFCFSALVDADSLDTEAHGLSGLSADRGSKVNLAELWNRYQGFLEAQHPAADSVINRVRQEVHEACLQMATEPPGAFRLTVPTGGGKTRSAMAFALRHGLAHGLRRVIVAVPFTTVTEQTASVYRQMFEEGHPDAGGVVLEHHSAAVEGTDEEDRFTRDAVWQRLTAENWDAPIVVTTTVQLFESLFSNRRSRVRKLHSLADSVIVIDEAQALPTGLLAPILDVIVQLTEKYGTSVVLSTATQPAFERVKEFREIDSREIVEGNARHFSQLKRVKYEWRTDVPVTWGEVAEWMRGEDRVLAIVNTKRHAVELLEALGDPNGLHLSTLLCGAHRSDVVGEIGRRLTAREPCRVVSTQVVEAGVDLDFPTVLRAEGPLDSVIQAAGRCNREGEMGILGRVVVFRPPDQASPPGVYRAGRDIAEMVRRFSGFDPDHPNTVHQYFDWLFDRAVDPDENGIQALRDRLDYPQVEKRFRMIKDDTYDVVVDYPGAKLDAEAVVEKLRTRRVPPRRALRQLQPYMVSLRQAEANRLQAQGWIEAVIPGMGIWRGSYDLVRGIAMIAPDLVI